MSGPAMKDFPRRALRLVFAPFEVLVEGGTGKQERDDKDADHENHEISFHCAHFRHLLSGA